jgi:hypothetical protein
MPKDLDGHGQNADENDAQNDSLVMLLNEGMVPERKSGQGER